MRGLVLGAHRVVVKRPEVVVPQRARVFKGHVEPVAQDALGGHVDAHIEFAQLKLEQAQVAIETVVGGAPSPRGGGHVAVSAAPRTHRLVHRAVLVKTRGASVHVFGRGPPSKKRGVTQFRAPRIHHPEPKITVVGAGLECVVRGRHAVGARREDERTGIVGRPAPSAHVNLPAIADEEGGGTDVDASHVARVTDACVPQQFVQRRRITRHKLARLRAVAVRACRDGLVADALAEEVHLSNGIHLHEVGLVVVVGAKQRPARWRAPARGEPHGKSIRHTAKRGVVTVGLGGEIARRRAPTQDRFAARRELHAVRRVCGASAHKRRPLEGTQIARQPKQHRVRGSAAVRRKWRIDHGEIRRARDAGHPRPVLGIHIDFAPEHVAVVVGEHVAAVHPGRPVAAANERGRLQIASPCGRGELHHKQARSVGQSATARVVATRVEVQGAVAAKRLVERAGRDREVGRARGAQHVNRALAVRHDA